MNMIKIEGTCILLLLSLISIGCNQQGGADVPTPTGIRSTSLISYQDLLRAEENPDDWLMYSGSYRSRRYSRLSQIGRNNLDELRLRWAYQIKSFEKFETTPLVVDGTMFITRPPAGVTALDSRTGREFWSYDRRLPGRISTCCGLVNRGLAILGNKVYMGTLDAHLIALDWKTGAVVWDTKVADYDAGYSITVAPLVVKDKIVVGISGGEFGIRGFLDAYDSETGKRVWRFYTIPAPGEPGSETWSGNAWKTGGGPTWTNGSFDPELDLIYWGTGNPAPDWYGDERPGDNLYTASVIALEADTGKLDWHFQFTPHDTHDWDANQIPVLASGEYQGQKRQVLLWGNRNGFFYVLDRKTGEFLLAKAFVRQTWTEGMDDQGRPILKPGIEPSEKGSLVYPGNQGGTNWYSPSYSPRTKLFYLSVWDIPSIFFSSPPVYQPGTPFYGSLYQPSAEDPGYGAVKALNSQTGEMQWEYRLHTEPHAGIQSGLLSTATDVLFGGTMQGQFFVLDAVTGEELWVTHLGGNIIAGPITYLSENKQQVSIAAGNSIFTFGLD